MICNSSKCRRVGRLFDAAVLLAVAWLMLRTWAVESRTVVGGSMAETMLGRHVVAVCGECDWKFAYGVERTDRPPRLGCPNCGAAVSVSKVREENAGERLLIDKSAFRFRSPRRWEAVALRGPHFAGRIVVKRVVGLPGESVRIIDGDVFADGEMQRKTLEQLRAVAVPVYHAGYPPESNGTSRRWRPSGDSRWQADAGRFTCDSPKRDGPFDWLSYYHDHPGSNDAITDRHGYNQGLSRRVENFRPVKDLMVSFRLRVGKNAQVAIRLPHRRGPIEAHLNFATGAAELRQSGQSLVGGELATPRPGSLFVEAAVCDAQFLLAIDGRQVFEPVRLDPHQSADERGEEIAVGARGGRVELKELRVSRDVYYSRPDVPPRWGSALAVQLADDEYFVLGDNSPYSLDSRGWISPGVPRTMLTGKPLAVFFAPRAVRFGSWRFQVPRWGRIRYIR